MGSLANSGDPDELLHNVVFHHCLHCLLQDKIFLLRNTIIFGNYNLLTPPFSTDYSNFIVSSFIETSIGLINLCLPFSYLSK